MTVTSPDERAWLARAVALAANAPRRTSPNPTVGCVLVRGSELVGEGVTAPVGGPHAEAAALTAAGEAAADATAYVSLEPCTHHGRTAPCADALAAAGVRRVVIAHRDPNPSAAGGASRLRELGVEVVDPDPDDRVLTAAVAAQLEGFLTAVAAGRPHVTLKLAQTADGQLTSMQRRWVTGLAARRAVHRWRAAVDAVVVGSGTVLADDPRLDVRHVPVRQQPRAVVLDARLRTPPTAAVARPGTLVVTATTTLTDAGTEPRAAALRARGVEVVAVPGAARGGVSLRPAMTALAERDITSVLAEPGARLASALVAADLVDRLVLHVATDLGEGAGRRAVAAPPGGPWRTERCGGAGEDLVLHLRPSVRTSASGLAVPEEVV